MIAFGSADHHVYQYDLRFPANPLQVYRGHHKAVSYVAWLDKDTIVSASIDGALKQWDTVARSLKRTHKGHVNEKHFCGLGVNRSEPFIATGSEDNNVVVYHSDISKPSFKFQFPSMPIAYPMGTSSSTAGKLKMPSTPFVTAVHWGVKNELIACNSKGFVKVLEVV